MLFSCSWKGKGGTNNINSGSALDMIAMQLWCQMNLLQAMPDMTELLLTFVLNIFFS